MSSNPDKIEKALSLLRQTFIDLNPDLIAKIETYKTTKSFSGVIGGKEGYHFDFKDFFEVLQKGFFSPNIRELFEGLMLLYFFKVYAELQINIGDYINHDSFKESAYVEASRKIAKIIKALNTVEKHITELLENIGIKNHDFLTKSYHDFEFLLSVLRIMRDANKATLHHYGDYPFIVSKIRVNDKPFVVTDQVTLKDGIIYTDKPEQIISMAIVAKPGIYIIANVPYGEMVNTAFYFLFTNNSDAILVENNKHSYRDQIYRTKTDGTDGKDDWLGRRYQDTYLPVNDVLGFFDNRSDSKDIIPKESNFSFKVIKKLSDCPCENILWTQAFVDNCVHLFNTTDILQQVSPTLAIEFIQNTEPTSDEKLNLPIAYKEVLPSSTQLNLSWDPERIGIDERNSGESLTPQLKEPSVSMLLKSSFSSGLTSTKQIESVLTYNRRKFAAKQLEKEIREDFIKNALSVRERIIAFVAERSSWVIERGLEDQKYPVTLYSTFGSRVKEIPEGQLSGVVYRSVLYTSDNPRERMYLRSEGSNNTVNCFIYDKNPSTLFLPITVKCSYCAKHASKYRYALNFLDYTQFKEFFKLTPELENSLPQQLRLYLNQSRTLYTGNSILNDIDPVSLIKNPWWVASINENWEKRKISWSNADPYLKIIFSLCGFCRKKFSKK